MLSQSTLELCFLSVRNMTDLFRQKKLSPVEVCTAVLARIDADNPTYNAMCLVDHERALATAHEAEQRWFSGAPQSAIDGVPTTIKDLVLTRDWPTLRGSLTVDPAGPWTVDAPATARLREAGAVLVGKTTTPEFGSKGVTDNPLTGSTRNAWNAQKTSGGSSGGAAVAAARGYGALHVGSDGAGSIRIPSAFNQTFGLKPTFGRVPAFPASPLGTVSHLGPMTRCVEDAAHMMTILSKPDARDWYALPAEERDYAAGLADLGERPLAGLRIAYSKDLGYAEVAEDVAEACAKAARHFVDLGAELIEIEGPLQEDPVWITDHLWFAAFLTLTRHMDAETVAQMDDAQQGMLAIARTLSAEDLMKAQIARADLAMTLCGLHETYDLLVTPAMPRTAFDVGHFNPWGSKDARDWIRWSSFTYPFNLSQQPAASCPCAWDTNGLPIGLQIVGRKYDDALVLRAARAFETRASEARKAPDLSASAMA